MQYLSVVLPLAAMVSGALATPAWGNNGGACQNNACLAAVTGKAALGDAGIRASHCSSYLATTVTPIVTETVTITGNGNNNWKRATVALCPNEVPNYASACDDAGYTSACSCFGYTEVKTTTVAPTTTTKTIWVGPNGGAASCTPSTVSVTATSTVVSGSTCPAPSTVTSTWGSHSTVTETKTGTVTVVAGSTCPAPSTVTSTWGSYSTVTETKTGTVTVVTGSTCPAGSATTVTSTWTKYGPSGSVTATTVTVTVATATTVTVATASTVTVYPSSSSGPASSCNVDDALATTLVNNFVNLLEFTSYAGNAAEGIPAGSGYNQDVSDATLATDFTDISDSINFMAGFPLGSVTFASKAAFDYGQGVLQPEVTVNVLNIWHDCNTITWRWRIVSLPYPVNGINYMEVNSDGLIQKNYAEFDNGAWLQSFGQNCTTASSVTVSSSAATKRGLLAM